MSLRSNLRQLKSVLTDARWTPFYLQRRVLSPAGRQRWADRISAGKPRWTGQAGAQSALWNTQLRDSGIAPLGSLLSPQQCREVLAYMQGFEVQDPYRPEAGRFLPHSEKRPSATHVAYHDAVDILQAPHLLSLANSPAILDAVAAFLGCKPTLDYLAAWWSYPTGLSAQQAENFHRDIDDWRFVKLFVYLTDVGPESGPHVYVTHSAEHAALRRPVRFTDAEVADAFGARNLQVVTGNAGNGFLENTQGVHKGQPVRAGRRAIFQAVYTVSGTPYGPRRPVLSLDAIPEPVRRQLDPWVNRVYLSAGAARR